MISGWPVLAVNNLPTLTADEMREVDRTMIEEFAIELPQMMENAGRNLADLALSLGRWRDGPRVCILAGGGNNGGGGLVCARHLVNRGAKVAVVLDRSPAKLGHAAAHQFRTVRAMEIPLLERSPRSTDLVVDALIGYGLSGLPAGLTADLVAWANAVDAPVLSLDVPTGLDATTGVPAESCIEAAASLTLALPKRGLLTEQARSVVGRLFLADISVPPAIYRHLGLRSLPFTQSSIVELQLS